MRLYHYSIIFVIIALIFVTLQDISYAEMSTVKDEHQRLDEAFTAATDNAVYTLIPDENRSIFSSISTSINAFYQSLFYQLNLQMDTESQLRVKLYLPCIAFIDIDGLYLCYWENTSQGLTQTISSRIPYSMDIESFRYEFTLADVYTRVQEKTNQAEELSINSEQMRFTQKETIRQTIENNILDCVNRHNYIGKQYGIKYQFTLPAMDQSVFSNAIEHPGILVMFQGYPFAGMNQLYERYVFAGASLSKKKGYCICKKDWCLVFHHPECKLIREEEIVGYCKNKWECANEGAYPCHDCTNFQ